ncbi:hypothetical protein V144x_10840 [Gimesia aquarii]|uniref:Uncharacterized protein n=1 Tax=Gimesia aquarii TaxID=2527964 RepID=A0A517VRJ5_9PLAN|nr:hypothetical protein V144x_10840 [Gimesia aquarii]
MSDNLDPDAKIQILHKQLRRLRVVMVLTTLSLGCMLYLLWDALQSHYALSLKGLLLIVCVLLFSTTLILNRADSSRRRKKIRDLYSNKTG